MHSSVPSNISLARALGGLISGAALAAVVAASPANAGAISIIGVQPGVVGENCGSGLHSTYLGATVTEFDFGGAPASSCSASNGPSSFYQDYGVIPSDTYGNLTFSGAGAALVIGTSSSAGAPWADSTPYMSVPIPGTTGGSETITINPALDDTYFGLYWGSIDTANTITFTLSNGNVATFTGADLGLGDSLSENGQNQIVTTTNEYVDFETTGSVYIDSVEFSDGDSVAFEVDNLAYGTIDPPDPVPEPASLSLFGAALLGLWALYRARRPSRTFTRTY